MIWPINPFASIMMCYHLKWHIDRAAAAAAAKSLQSCPNLRPHRWQPTRLLCPWDSPGKNTGVGCHFLLQCMKVKSESEVAQSFPTLSDPMDYSLPGSSVHRIFPGKSTGVGCHCLLHIDCIKLQIHGLSQPQSLFPRIIM